MIVNFSHAIEKASRSAIFIEQAGAQIGEKIGAKLFFELLTSFDFFDSLSTLAALVCLRWHRTRLAWNDLRIDLIFVLCHFLREKAGKQQRGIIKTT